ncbi:hypothetical protein HHK36_033436 [Tetracentron sinense]|uniref:Receptor-like serine/threonine-protein kinase n=1 Tax=Tetracentron sinense TaxID=13715 RepID=A0A835CZI4_TETSI|nr:hypothetical protein HHK36_033436 [Tetracentron sinense]
MMNTVFSSSLDERGEIGALTEDPPNVLDDHHNVKSTNHFKRMPEVVVVVGLQMSCNSEEIIEGEGERYDTISFVRQKKSSREILQSYVKMGRTVSRRSVSPILSTIFAAFLLFTCSSLLICSARDTIAPNDPLIGDGETLVSAGKTFELGFFSPNRSSNSKRYVGIWYYGLVPPTVVWVANRDAPLSDSSGFFGNDGNLKVFDGNGSILWSTSVESAKAASAKLLDSGNLILQEGNDEPIWQSFFDDSHPSDTFLPGMMMEGQELKSWKNESDPSPGDFTFRQIDKQFIISNGSAPYWRSGTSDDSWSFDQIPKAVESFLSNFRNTNSTTNPTYSNNYTRPSSNYNHTRLVMHSSGQIRHLKWNARTKMWDLSWWEPSNSCRVYQACGAYGICNSNSTPVCTCLPGYRPFFQNAWDSGQFSGGCTRKTTECGKDDVFRELKKMRVEKTESELKGKSEEECKAECRKRCCFAYSFESSMRRPYGSPTCWFWYEELKNLQGDSPNGGRDLYLRLTPSDLETTGRGCGNCGPNTIPYPLSTGPTCGDLAYFSFYCNTSTGQLHFKASNGSSYIVSRINPEKQTFVIQLEDAGTCGATGSTSKQLHISNSFYMANNTILLLLNCSTLRPQLPLDCTSSSPCHGYIKERKPCFDSHKCCSYTNGNSSSKLHEIGVLNSGCNAYTSIVSSDISTASDGWSEGVEIGWEPPSEPMCNSSNDCGDWPNSTCQLNMTVHGNKRCYCNENFRWDPYFVNCTQDVGDTKQLEETSQKKRPLSLMVILTISIGILLFCTLVCIYYLRRRRIVKREDESDQRGKDFTDSNKFREDKTPGIDIPFFDLETILAATENFSKSNKLGQGGFGPVYKYSSLVSTLLLLSKFPNQK